MKESDLFGKDWWHEAYTIERRATRWLCFEFALYAIIFDGTTLMELTSRSYAEDLVSMLNGAYNLGRSNMRMEIETL